MSSDRHWVLERVPPGKGLALDLGGGSGRLGPFVRRLGYSYLNVDRRPGREAHPATVADAMALPIRTAAVTLVISSDSLEHFRHPELALREVRRVILDDGLLVIWVPFLHPFHGDDLFRFTPLGLRSLLEDAGFVIRSIESPLWAASVMAQGAVALFQRFPAGTRLEQPLERVAAWIDQRLGARRRPAAAFAAAYLVVADPLPNPPSSVAR